MYPILLFIPLFYSFMLFVLFECVQKFILLTMKQQSIHHLNVESVGYQLNISEITSVEFTSELQQSTFSWTLGSRNFPQYDAPLGPWRINN